MADPVAAGLPPSRRRRTAEQLEADQSSLIELRSKLPFISQSALSEILKFAAREPLPTLSSAQAIRKCRDTRVATLTPYGAIHQAKVHAVSGKTFEFQHPFAMLYYVCKVSAVMSKLVSQLPPSSPDAPLSMIFTQTRSVLEINCLTSTSAKPGDYIGASLSSALQRCLARTSICTVARNNHVSEYMVCVGAS